MKNDDNKQHDFVLDDIIKRTADHALDEELDMIRIAEDDAYKSGLEKHTEVINGVYVVYTGSYNHVHQGYKSKYSWEGGGHEDLGYKLVEDIEMYDQYGNKFYSNAQSIEKANKIVEELSKRGITAVIGPCAPMRNQDGTFVKGTPENYVGIFIVSVPKKDDCETPHKTR